MITHASAYLHILYAFLKFYSRGSDRCYFRARVETIIPLRDEKVHINVRGGDGLCTMEVGKNFIGAMVRGGRQRGLFKIYIRARDIDDRGSHD